jgi:hypothetical protein
MTDEINVVSRTQVIMVEPSSGTVSVINAGPPGPAGPVGVGSETDDLIIGGNPNTNFGDEFLIGGGNPNDF